MNGFGRGILFLGLVIVVGLTGCDSDDIVVPSDENISDTPPLVDVPFSIGADEYLDNRFFALDLPEQELHGRNSNELIDVSSVSVFKSKEPGIPRPNEINNVAVYVDSAGCGVWDDLDFQNPYYSGLRWEQIPFDIMFDEQQNFIAIDLGQEFKDAESYLAVIYDVVLPDGTLVHRVGDRPGWEDPTLILDPDSSPYYRMKLLKAPILSTDPHVFQYVLRNIYSLGSANIDLHNFDLQIEALDGGATPEMANGSLPWLQVFGLDQSSTDGTSDPDGIIDWEHIDGRRGLLVFPWELAEPFAAESAQYMEYVEPGEFVWENSYLQQNLMPQIYDPSVDPETYSQYRTFQISGYTQQYDLSGILSDEVPMARIEWFRASAPAQTLAGDRQFQPEGRVGHVRWFLPKERTLSRYQNPDLTGASGDKTVPVMDLFLWEDDDSWESESWGGIMHGVGPFGADLSGYSGVEIWVNDGHPDREERTGTLHIDFGYISEDGFWPVDVETGELIIGRFEQEDGILCSPACPDGLWQSVEDVGLNYQDLSGGDPYGLEDFSSDLGSDDDPFPGINGTAGNFWEDTEDINGNYRFDLENSYFTHAIDLKETEPLVDVLSDYEDVEDLAATGLAWRKYRLSLDEFGSVANSGVADLTWISHLRLWYEDDSVDAQEKVHLQFSGFKFIR